MRKQARTLVEGVSNVPSLNFDDDTWQRISAASGIGTLPDDAWISLAEILKSYMVDRRLEQAGVAAQDIARYIEKLRGRAEGLTAILMGMKTQQSVRDGSLELVDEELAALDNEFAPHRLQEAERLLDSLHLLVAACDRALSRASTARPVYSGDAWGALAIGLREWRGRYGLSTDYGTNSDAYSDGFIANDHVRFVSAVVAELPVEFRVDFASLQALRMQLMRRRRGNTKSPGPAE